MKHWFKSYRSCIKYLVPIACEVALTGWEAYEMYDKQGDLEGTKARCKAAYSAQEKIIGQIEMVCFLYGKTPEQVIKDIEYKRDFLKGEISPKWFERN